MVLGRGQENPRGQNKADEVIAGGDKKMPPSLSFKEDVAKKGGYRKSDPYEESEFQTLSEGHDTCDHQKPAEDRDHD